MADMVDYKIYGDDMKLAKIQFDVHTFRFQDSHYLQI